MQELGLVPSSELDFADYHSYHLTWYDGEYDSIRYGEPLLSSQGVYDCSNSEKTEDYSSRSLYADRSTDQGFRGMGNAEIGSGNWFGEYESYFGDYWGGGEAYLDGWYQEDSSYQEQKDGISSSNDDDMAQDYSENQWFGYGDFGFEDDWEDFQYQGSPEFQYNSSWDEWEETILYEQIFGD